MSVIKGFLTQTLRYILTRLNSNFKATIKMGKQYECT